MGTVANSMSADGSGELFTLLTRSFSSSYEKGYGSWMAQYFEPLQKVLKREQCYLRATVKRTIEFN